MQTAAVTIASLTAGGSLPNAYRALTASAQADAMNSVNRNSKESIAKRLMRRQGTVVAYVALFAALGGSAYAEVSVSG